MNKTCSRCGLDKDLIYFSKDKYHTSGYKSACKVCAKNDHASWRKKNHEYIKLKDRITHYIRKYGLSEEEARNLVDSRVGVCEICGKEAKLVIDHCHSSGKIRGKICSHCNSVLGYAKDDVIILQKSIEYLKNFYGK